MPPAKLSNRETSLVGGFMVLIGLASILIHLHSAFTAAAPVAGSSSFRALISSLFVAAFGVPAGYVAYNIAWVLLGGILVWLGAKVFRHQ